MSYLPAATPELPPRTDQSKQAVFLLSRAVHPRSDHRCGRTRRPTVLLHLDKDFELIAKIPGQPVERLNIQ